MKRSLRLVAVCVFGLSSAACSSGLGSAKVSQPAQPDPQQWLAMGKELASQGQNARAEQYLLAAWAEGAALGEALPPLLEITLSEGRLRTAAGYLERARRTRPRDPYLLRLSVTVHLALGQERDVRRELEELAALEANYPEAVYFLGEHFLHLKEHARARVLLERYVETWPNAENASWARHLLEREADLSRQMSVTRTPEAAP